MYLVELVIYSVLVTYILFSFSIYTIAKMMNHDFAVLSFVPVLGFYLVFDMAGYYFISFVLFIVTLVGSIFFPFAMVFPILFFLLISFNFAQRTLGDIFVTFFVMFFPIVGFPLLAYSLVKKRVKAKGWKSSESLREARLREMEEDNFFRRLGINAYRCKKCGKINKLREGVNADVGRCIKCNEIILIN